MSITTSADEWVRKSPTRAIAVIAAVGVVVGGLIGLGVGFKVEQSRTKSDLASLRKQLKAKGTSTGVPTGLLGQRIGKVTAAKPGSFTVTTKRRGTQTLTTTADTVFEEAVRGTIADVNSGDRVLVTIGGNEIIVLPPTSKLGRIVEGVGSDSIKIAKGNGHPAGAIKTGDVHLVSNAKPAKAADVSNGDSVFAGGRARSQKTFAAIEIILIPAGSGFAN